MRKTIFFSLISGVIIIAAITGVIMFKSTSQTSTSFVANLTGDQEVPPVNSTASGEAVFTLSADGASMTFVLNVTNITDVVASHIHLAPAGVSGGVVVPLFVGPKPGLTNGILAQGTITAADLKGSLLGKPFSALVTEIIAGNTYVNVHTTANPAGEIRGQIRIAP